MSPSEAPRVAALGGGPIGRSWAAPVLVGRQQPGRFVLGHPFNPPHLIPLVAVTGNERTDAGVAARRFHETIGKLTIEARREAPHERGTTGLAALHTATTWSTP